jgi:2-dehydropantoate 2-reductase
VNLRITIIGAGGVGAFFGALLVRGGQDVGFVARGAQLDALRTRGIRIESTLLGTIDLGPVPAAAHASELGPAGLVLVCVKAHQTPAIVDEVAALLGDRTVVLTLQNGVDSDEVLAARFGPDRVWPAVVYVGATVERPGVVSHVAAGTIALGAREAGMGARLAEVRDVLATSGQPVRISEDIQCERWRKLIWNASFNTVSAITGRTPRDLLASPETRQLLTSLMREVVAVARVQGIRLEDKDADDQIAWTDRAQAIRTSMMVDRERGRPMETEALIGVVVRRGREHGVPTPHSDTMYALLKGLK